MAERRMFAKKIMESDTFLDMPYSAQCLYIYLNMNADDDGFLNNPRKIQRMLGCSDNDMKSLIDSDFIIAFDSGIVVIKHWLIHNLIRKDRYTKTDYVEEMKMLKVEENKAYSLINETMATTWQPNDNQMTTNGIRRLGKDRLGKDNINTFAQSDLENPSTPEEEPVITLTLQDNSEYAVVENQLKEWQELYPSIDVMQELRKMKGWLNANPTKRKTKRGIKKFINSWLARAFDRAPKGTKKELPKWFNDQDIVQMGDETVDDDELMKQLRALRGEKKA